MSARRRIARSWLALALLILPTPGCLTAMLWRSQGPSDRVIEREHFATAAVVLLEDLQGKGAVLVEARRESGDVLPPLSGLARRQSQWRMRPAKGAAEALVLLRGGHGFVVDEVRLEVVRRSGGGCVTQSRGCLLLTERVPHEDGARAVALADLPVATVAALGDAQAAGALAAAPVGAWPELPAGTRELMAIDPAVWAPSGLFRSPTLLGLVWTDRELRPLGGDRDVTAPGAGSTVEDLRVVALVGEAVDRPGAVRPTFFVLQADRIARWRAMTIDPQGHRIHRSQWHLDADVAPAAESRADAALADGTMHLRYVEARYLPGGALTAVAKVLLTPFAAVGDVLIAASGVGIVFVGLAQQGHTRWEG